MSEFPEKNTKRFDDGTPLIHCILNTLVQCKSIAESYVYCSNEAIRECLPEIFIETTGLYIFTRDVIMNRQSKIGYKPFLLEKLA